VEASGRAGLLLLPSGGGKSSIAALLAQDPAVKIFSDESPLVDRQGRLHPFPVRLALLPEVARALELNPEARLFRRKIYAAKQLFPIARSQTAASAPVSFVLIGVPGISPSVASVSKWRIFRALFLNAVVGLGLAQMSEHFLRLPGALRVLRIAWSRLSMTMTLCQGARRYGVLTLGRDPRANALALKAFAASDPGA
ncbi:MAG: hypothetical protein ACXVBW_08700, partial [Bdellovibrionota bacterium]